MAFGQPTGPPATARQLRDLTTLIEAAGHADFKDARGPLGLNQRQAGGRFTQDEVTELIARLEADAEADSKSAQGPPDGSESADGHEPPASQPRAASRTQSLARQLQRVPEEMLVEELRRRGWKLVPPSPNP